MFRFTPQPQQEVSSTSNKDGAPDDSPHTLHYVLVVDCSGSMVRRMPSVIKSVNGQIEKLAAESKEGSSDCLLTVVRFNEDLHVVMLEQPIEKVSPLTEEVLWARGCTALIDATTLSIERAAQLMGHRIDGKRESLAIVIYTDGMENASKHRNMNDLRYALSRHQDLPGWDIAFVGASLEAFQLMEQAQFSRRKMVHLRPEDSAEALDDMGDLLAEKMMGKASFDLSLMQDKMSRK